jgi:hypothetical protein
MILRRKSSANGIPNAMTYLIRWVDRVPHKNYVKTLQNADQWRGKLHVIVHGKGPLDAPLLCAKARGLIDYTDLRGVNPEGHLPPMCETALAMGASRGYDVVGLMDDDAYTATPMHMLRVFAVGVRDHNLGAMGPLTQYVHMARWKSEPGPYFEVNPRIWATAGAQFYSGEFLRERGNWIKKLYRVLKWRQDPWMWMLAHWAGYDVAECWTGYWWHRTSLAGDGRALDDAWYNKRIRQIEQGTSNVRSFFTDLPEGPRGIRGLEYLPSIQTVYEEELDYLRRKSGRATTK